MRCSTIGRVAGRHRGTVLEHVVVSGDPNDEGRLIGLVDPLARCISPEHPITPALSDDRSAAANSSHQTERRPCDVMGFATTFSVGRHEINADETHSTVGG